MSENTNQFNNQIQCIDCPPAVKIEVVQNDVQELKMEDKRIHERIDKVIDSMNDKISDTSKEINNVERKLSDRMIVLEATYRLTTESINTNIKNLSEKFDKMLEDDKIKTNRKADKNFEWFKGLGLIIATLAIAYIFSKLGIK